MTWRSLLLISLFCILSGALSGQKKKKRKLSIEERIEYLLNDPKKPINLDGSDLLIALIDSTDIKYIDRISRSSQNHNPSDLIFELGDLTQVFTSLLVHELARDGRLDLSQSINLLLPNEFQSTYFQEVTLQDCLSHTTGLPRLPNNIGTKQIDHNQPFEFYSSSDLASFIKAWVPSKGDRKYKYSLIGYELVGIVLKHQFKKSFEQLIQDVLNPRYGFKSLTTDTSSLSRKGKNKVGNDMEPMRFASFSTSSGLKASRSDIERLVFDTTNLTREAFRESLNVRSPTDVDPFVSIASGWHHYEVSKRHSFYLHKGSTKGFSSFIGYHPGTKTAAIILSSKKINLGPIGYYIIGQLNDGWKR